MDNLLQKALVQYAFEAPEAELIQHNENLTYQITDAITGKRYAMRIHRPHEGFSLGIFGEERQFGEYRQGETDLLNALGENTSLPLQKPVPNKAGNYNTVLDDGTSVSVLTWIEGQPLDAVEITAEMRSEIGTMLGRLHTFLKGWSGRNSLKRFSYDKALLRRIDERIEETVKIGALTPAQRAVIGTALNEAGRRMEELDSVPDSYGIVHADLSKSNLIVCGRHIVPIDFSLCGFSYYYMDLGSLYAHFTDPAEQLQIAAAYAKATGSQLNPRYIEPFLALQVLLFIAYQYKRAASWDWFGDAAERWCRELFRPLAEGEPFI